MTPLDEHIAILSDIITSTDDVKEWSNVYDWLNIAASIESVNLDTLKYDHSFGWCESAYDYDIARDELLQIFTTHLAIFNFVWGGLESAIDIVKPPKNPNKDLRGKISNTCSLLGKFNNENTIPELINEVQTFKSLAVRCYGYEDIEKRFQAILHFGDSGIGLYAVYTLRNLFAHGSMVFPQPDGDDRPICIENDLVICATRIVLLSMQLLLIHHFQPSENYEIYLVSCRNWINGDMSLDKALRSCHLPAE